MFSGPCEPPQGGKVQIFNTIKPVRDEIGRKMGMAVQGSEESPLLVYIASDVRSGSTLLDMMLGSHAMVESVGEIQFLNDHFNRQGTGYSWDWKCTCGQYFDDCSFWTEVDKKIVKKTGLPISSHETWVRRKPQPFLLLLLPNWLLQIIRGKIASVQRGVTVASVCWDICDALVSVSGKKIIVDSSKISEQFRYLFFYRPTGIRMIYLVRDGRGVMYSKMTRAGDSARKASKNWVLENLKIIAIKMMIPRNQSIAIKYEDLCTNPQQEIDRICHFLKIPVIESTLSKSDRHNVCGSPHRFEKDNTKIMLDERWKIQLDNKDKRVFSLVGGWLNYLLGYR